MRRLKSLSLLYVLGLALVGLALLSSLLNPPQALAQTGGGIVFNPATLGITDTTTAHPVQITWTPDATDLISEGDGSDTLVVTLTFPNNELTIDNTNLTLTDGTAQTVKITLTSAGQQDPNYKSGGIQVKASDSQGLYTATLAITSTASTTTNPANPSTTPAAKTPSVNTSVPAALQCSSGAGSNPNCNLAQLIADPNGFVYKSWQLTRGIINVVLIIALLVIAFSNILRINIDTYTVKKSLPNLIIGIVLANLSFLIIKYMADLCNASVYLFVQAVSHLSFGSGAAISSITTFNQMIGAVASAIGVTSIGTIFGSGITQTLGAIANPIGTAAGAVVGGSAGAIIGVIPGALGIGILFMVILVIITIIVLIWLAFILYFRLLAIYLLTILAPLAFVAYGIPGLEKYFKQWWQQFIKWLFILPAMAAIFWLMLVIDSAAAGNYSIAVLLINYALIVFALQLPSKMGGKLVDGASKAFQKYSGADAGKKYVVDEAKNYGRYAGSIVGEKTGFTRYQELLKQNKANLETKVEQRRKKAATRAMGGKVGLTTASLEHEGTIIDNDTTAQKQKNIDRARTDEIADRLNNSEFAKKTAEQLNKVAEDIQKLKFYNSTDSHIKDAVENLARATSRASAMTEAVGTQEKIVTGNQTKKRLDVLTVVDGHAKAKKELEAIANDPTRGVSHSDYASKQAEVNKFATQYNALAADPKFTKDHPDFAGKSIDQVTNTINTPGDVNAKIWEAERKKQAKSYDASVDASTEDMRKNGTVTMAVNDDDYKSFHSTTNTPANLHPSISKLASGDTVGVSMEDQDKFQKYNHILKGKMQSRNDPDYKEAMKAAITTHVLNGGQDLKLQSGVIIHGGNAAEVTAHLNRINSASLNDTVLSDTVSAIHRLKGFGGTASSHINKNG